MKTFALALIAVLSASAAFAQNPPANKLQFKTDRQRMSYGIGLNIGRSLADDRVDLRIVDPAWILKGVADVLAGKPSAMTEDEFMAAMEKLQSILQQRRAAEKKAADQRNEALYAQKKNEGFQLTKTGLLYKVEQAGTGKSPGLKDTVKVHYKGTLPNGAVFDSSYERQEPVELPVEQFIPGWIEALQMMKEGGKWTLVIPPELAYGETGGNGIPPHAVLVFDIELLEVVE